MVTYDDIGFIEECNAVNVGRAGNNDEGTNITVKEGEL